MSYLAPTTLNDALQALAAKPFKVLAGGTDVFPALNDRPLSAPTLDLSRIQALCGIEQGEGVWRLGATTTWSDILTHPLPSGFAALQAAAREVGAVQIQNAGTIAGNLCNASPAADGVPPLLALDAEVELASVRGTRRLKLQDFITGVRKTALAPDELVTAIIVPFSWAGSRSAFLKLGSRSSLVISIVMVAVNLKLEGGRIAAARVAVGACSPVAQRLPELEQALIGKTSQEAIAVVSSKYLSPLSPIDDVRATAAYRLTAAEELIRRALVKALEAA